MRVLPILLLLAGCDAMSTPNGPIPPGMTAYSPALTGSHKADGFEEAPPPHFAVLDADIEPTDEPQGEDGLGNMISAIEPLLVELDAEQWPGRAEDPVLYIGELHFHDYSFVSRTTLRFVIADRAALPAGAPAVLRWGSDADRVLATSWESL